MAKAIVKEIPISRDILEESPFNILAHPPKFPLLKGEEEIMIIDRLIELTNSGDVKWLKLFINPSAWVYVAGHKGLRFQVSDFLEKNLAIIPLDTLYEVTDNGKSFSGKKVEDLILAIEAQNPKGANYTRYHRDGNGIDGKNFFEKVWDILN